jgi:hypothetical protein
MPETGNARQQARLSFACNLLDFSSFFQLRVTIGVTMTYSWAQWWLTRTRLLGGHAPASQATADTAGITKQPSAFSVPTAREATGVLTFQLAGECLKNIFSRSFACSRFRDRGFVTDLCLNSMDPAIRVCPVQFGRNKSRCERK